MWTLVAAFCLVPVVLADTLETNNIASTRSVRRLMDDQGLPKQVCDNLAKFQICSQRASALELALDESTLDSFRGLWDAGFTCFDMEFVATKDMQLVAARPERLRWAIEELKPDEVPWPSTYYTVRQLRELGASIYQLPTLDQFLRDLRRRMVDTDEARKPWVLVRLDGVELRPELLRQIQATANRHRALEFLILVFSDSVQLEALQKTGLWTGKVMRALPANTSLEIAEAEGRGPFAALGASMQSTDQVLQAFQDSGKLVFADAVEDVDSLLGAVVHGFSGISTLFPLRLQQTLQAWKAECRAGNIHTVIQPDVS